MKRITSFYISTEVNEELRRAIPHAPNINGFVEDAIREKLDKLQYTLNAKPDAKPEMSQEEMRQKRIVKQARLRFFAGLHVGKATEQQVWSLRRIGVKKIAHEIPDMGTTEWYWKLHEVKTPTGSKTVTSKVIPDDYIALIESIGSEFSELSEDG